MSRSTTTNVSANIQNLVNTSVAQMQSISKNLIDPLSMLKPPPVIYHYTDADGLRGILETGSLRFADIFGLNDPSELRHGMQHAAKMLAKASVGGPAELIGFANLFGGFADSGVLDTASYFVACFSSLVDRI